MSDTVRKEQGPFELLSEPWKQTLEKELELLEMERSEEAGLLRSEIADRKKYLGLLAERQETDDLDKYPQAKIDEANSWFSKQQEKLEGEKRDLEEKVKEIAGKVTDQEKEVKNKEQVLQDLLNELKALPGTKKTAEETVTDLEAKLAAAKGTTREELIAPEYEAAKERRDRLSDEDYAKKLKTAIEEWLAKWQESKDKLKELVATGTDAAPCQEDLQVEIKQIDKVIAYLKEHRDALVLEYLKRPVQE